MGIAFQVQVYDLRLLFLYCVCKAFAAMTMFSAVNASPLLPIHTQEYHMK